jgi:DNA-binding HxlR family transcriptional regulator
MDCWREWSDTDHMLRRTYDGQFCSLAWTLEAVGERWTLLIVRDALRGVCRFDEFRDELGLAGNVLADRLRRLVDYGIFDRVQYQDRPARFEYQLSDRGRELSTAVTALMHWGDRHLAPGHVPPVLADHGACGEQVEVWLVCRRCGRSVSPGEIVARPNPAARPP